MDECLRLNDSFNYCGFNNIISSNNIECCKWNYLIVNSIHYDKCRIPLTNNDINDFYDSYIIGNTPLFVVGWIIQILCFIIVLYYFIMFVKAAFCYDRSNENIVYIMSRINKSLIVLTPIVMILCLISIGTDIYHMLAPYLKLTRDTYECGIRDRNFRAIRVVADVAQFWGYLIFWGMMVYRLKSSFHQTTFALGKFTYILLIVLIIINTIFLLSYNIAQLLRIEHYIDFILFTGYVHTSIVLNCIIMILFSMKLTTLLTTTLSLNQQ